MELLKEEDFGESKAFDRYLKALRGRVGEAKYKSWFVDLGLAEVKDDCVTLSTGSQSKCDMLDTRFLPMLADTWRSEVGPVRKMRLTVREKLKAHAAKLSARQTAPGDETNKAAIAIKAPVAQGNNDNKTSYANIAAPLDPRRTFDNYAVGDSNRMAWAAARQALVQEGPREIIYIYGESGLGKTHLLHAVGHEFEADNARGGGIYVTYRNLINACVNAALGGASAHLHEALLSYDLLAFDDIHFLEGKDRTQEELLVVIDTALDSGKQVIIAGDMPPAKLAEAGIKKRLADRLAGGLCAPVHQADEALRLAILKKRVESATAKCRISDEALEFIARTFTQSTRETIGALNQLLLMFASEDIVVDLDQAKTILKSRLVDSRKLSTLEDAIAAGAEAFGLKLEDMTGRSQPQRIVRARHAVVWCAREVLKESFPRIGKALKRDHTTVMSSYRRAQALLERDKVFQDAVQRIREAIEN